MLRLSLDFVALYLRKPFALNLVSALHFFIFEFGESTVLFTFLTRNTTAGLARCEAQFSSKVLN